MVRKIAIIVLVLLITSCREEIVQNLSESDATRLITKLHITGLAAEKAKQSDGTWAVTVASGESMRALQYLDKTRLLKKEHPNQRDNLSLVSSREDQRFHFERALSREIESTIASLEGVFEARVHLNIAPKDPLFGTAVKSSKTESGSVLLIVAPEFSISRSDLAEMVSGASGIPAEKISVLLSVSEIISVEATPVVLAQAGQSSGGAIWRRFTGGATSFSATTVSYALLIAAIGLGVLFYSSRWCEKRKIERLSTLLE